LPKSTSLTINANGIADVKNDTEIHRWFAGANYIGNVDMSPEYPFIWHCSGGTCNLEGPYGTGLNMRVCQLLSKKVGGLEYYYNDAGMRWTKAENAPLLKQCNDLNT
jgi:hypothetical protein